MTIQDLQLKVTAAEEKVTKCKGTIERHKKQLDKCIKLFNEISIKYFGITYEEWTVEAIRDTDVREIYWCYCDIKHKEDDIKNAIKKLEDAERIYNNWIEKLNTEEANQAYIANSIPAVIKSFLEDWKTQTIEFMWSRRDKYYKDYEQYKRDRNYCFYTYMADHRNDYTYLDSKYLDNFDETFRYFNYCNSSKSYNIIKRDYDIEDIDKAFKTKYSDPLFVHYKSTRFDDEWLDKTIEKEKNDKLLDLMSRVTRITGVITDAGYLRIHNGELNGIIVGEKGSVTVNTIGAGGYNIQRFHWRTLVKKI